MTAAKVMDIISRVQGCARQAADAVSANTQVEMEDAHKLLKNPKSECPDIWIRLLRHIWPKSWSSMEDPVVLLELNRYGHPLARLLWRKAIWENPIEVRLGQSFQLGTLIRTPWKRINFLWPNWLERNKINPMWKVLNKEVDLGEPTSFFNHENLVCIPMWNKQGYCWQYWTMFESRISARATEKVPCLENLCISSWSYDLEGHAKKCVERYCALANKTTQQLHTVSINQLHALMTIIPKKTWNPWESCQKYALKLFWNAYTWHVLEDLIFCGQWTNLQDRWRNGPKPVTND